MPIVRTVWGVQNDFQNWLYESKTYPIEGTMTYKILQSMYKDLHKDLQALLALQKTYEHSEWLTPDEWRLALKSILT